MTIEERMILAHEAGRDFQHEGSTSALYLSEIAEERYSDPDERMAFLAGARGERIRYDAWLRSWRARQ